MTDRTELQRERDELAQMNQSTIASIAKRQRTIDERASRIAAIDAELAKLPEGWIPASEPPADGDTAVHERDVLVLTLWDGDMRVHDGWHSNNQWLRTHPDGDVSDITDRVIGWREIPADWLAAQPKYPRYFTQKFYTINGLAYVRVEGDGSLVAVEFDGAKRDTQWDEDDVDRFVARGDWLEITAAEAEAMVRPRQLGDYPLVEVNAAAWDGILGKPKVEPTTERLVKLVACAGYERTRAETVEIVRRVEAADHSVDLRTLWEEPGEKHHIPSKVWLAKIARGSDEVVYRCVEWFMGQWVYAGQADRTLFNGLTILALADPAKLIGGAS